MNAAPLPLRDGATTVAQLIDAYMAVYQGKDDTRPARLSFWRSAVGALPVGQLDDDAVHAARQQLQGQRARVFAGHDADGRPVLRARKGTISGPTVNRYTAALAAVITWAIRERLTPKGYVHPVRMLKANPENPGRVRFLSDDERARLLEACKASKAPRLYLFVLAAITTGARRGELLGLRWADVDLERRQAHVARSKNGDRKVLVLLPAVVEELRRFVGAPGARVFPGTRRADCAMAIEGPWRAALKAARIARLRIHDLRHTTASYLAQNGATLLDIADVLGHRTVRMAARYSHLTTGHRAALLERVLGDVR